MTLPGLSQKVDKQAERNKAEIQAKTATEVQQYTPPSSAAVTRNNKKKNQAEEITPIQTWVDDDSSSDESMGDHEEESLRKRKRGDKIKQNEKEEDTVKRGEVQEWSFKGDGYYDGVAYIQDNLKDGDYVSTATFDVSNFLVPEFVNSDKAYRERCRRDPLRKTEILKERRCREFQTLNLAVDTLQLDFTSLSEVNIVYDNEDMRPKDKDLQEIPRLRKQAERKIRRLLRMAIEKHRADSNPSGPPRISTTEDDELDLPAFSPPTAEELSPLPPSASQLDRDLQYEAIKLHNAANLYVALGEADPLCRMVISKSIPSSASPYSYFSPARQPRPAIAPSLSLTEHAPIGRPLRILCATDSVHSALNSHLTCDYSFSWSSNSCRVIDFLKRFQHPFDWMFSSHISSTMAMAVAGCDLIKGLPDYTVQEIGDGRNRECKLTSKQQGELVLLDICENAEGWTKAYHTLDPQDDSLPSHHASVRIKGKIERFTDLSDLTQRFDSLLSPLFRSSLNRPEYDMTLASVVRIFDSLNGQVDSLVAKSDLRKELELEVENQVNLRLAENYGSPSIHNHSFSSLNRRPDRSPSTLPKVRKPKRSPSLPPSLRTPPSTPTSRRSRRATISGLPSPSPTRKENRPYQERQGGNARKLFQNNYESLEKMRVAVENAKEEESEEQPRKRTKTLPSKDVKGKGKAVEKDEEAREGEGSTEVKGKPRVKAGSHYIEGVLSTLPLPNRPSTFNNLIGPGLDIGVEFNHAVRGVLNDVLNLYLNECPMIVDSIQLLLSLYLEFSPTLFSLAVNGGGQAFGRVVSILVQRLAAYYEETPLGSEVRMDGCNNLDEAPNALESAVGRVRGMIRVEKWAAFRILVETLRFTGEDMSILGTAAQVNLFFLIVVKLRRICRFPPPLIRNGIFIQLNFTTCGTGYCNALVLRGRQLHRSVATDLVDNLLDFAPSAASNPYGVSSTSFSNAYDDLSPTSKIIMKSINTKRLIRLVSIYIYHSPLPNTDHLTSSTSVDDNMDIDLETPDSLEGVLSEEDLYMWKGAVAHGYHEDLVRMEEDQESVSEYQEDANMDDQPEEDLVETLDPAGYASRITQLIRTSANRNSTIRLTSDEIIESARLLTTVIVEGTDFVVECIGADYLEAVKSSKDGETMRNYCIVGDIVVGSGGKKEALRKNEKGFIVEEEEEEEGDPEEDEEQDSRFTKSVALSTAMRLSAQIRVMTRLPIFNFEPDGYHATPRLIQSFVDPSNEDYLPNRLAQLFQRIHEDTIVLNQVVEEMRQGRSVRPFKLPSAHESTSPDSSPQFSHNHQRAHNLLRTLIKSKESRFLLSQSKNPDTILFATLHDWIGIDYEEVSSSGPLPVRKLSQKGYNQFVSRSAALHAFRSHLNFTLDDFDQIGMEYWHHLIKPSPGGKKLFHGNVYVTREKFNVLCVDVERYTPMGLKKVIRVTNQPLSAIKTAEALLSNQQKIVKVYEKLDQRLTQYRTASNQPEFFRLKTHVTQDVENTSSSPSHQRKLHDQQISPFAPLLRLERSSSPSQLRFVSPSPSTAVPRLDDRRPQRLSLVESTAYSTDGKIQKGNAAWKELVETKFDPWVNRPVPLRPLEPPLPLVDPVRLPSTSPAFVPAPSCQKSPSSSSRPSTSSNNQLPAPSHTLLSESLSEQQHALVPRPKLPAPAEADRMEIGAEVESGNWKADTQRWLKRENLTVPSPAMLATDCGRAYTLDTVKIGVREGKVSWYRSKSTETRRWEKDWKATLEALNPFESRHRLRELIADPAEPSTDLSILFRRPTILLPPLGTTTASLSPLESLEQQIWFPSQLLSTPPSLQGPLVHTADYLHSRANYIESIRSKSSLDSNASKQWNQALPRPIDGSKRTVAMIVAKESIAGIQGNGGKGHGIQNSGPTQQAAIHALKSMPWIDLSVWACSEGYTSSVCPDPTCRATLVHPCRTGDPAHSEILRLLVCIRCWLVYHRDDVGALNLWSVAMGIAKVGAGNVLSPDSALLVNNLNRLSKYHARLLCVQLRLTLNHLSEPERVKRIETLKRTDSLLEVLKQTRAGWAELDVEEMEEEERSKKEEV